MKCGSIDWMAIKTEYITTGICLRDLAKKYGVGKSRIGSLCKQEGWVRARKDYQDTCMTKAIQESGDIEVNRLIRLMEAADEAIEVAFNALEDHKQFNRYIITESIGGATKTEERLFRKVDSRALKEYTSILKDLTALMRDFYNIPTPAQVEAQRIASERLELDRKKAEAGIVTDTKLEIVGIPEAYLK